VHRWVIVASIALGTSGQAWAQPLGYYAGPDAYGAPPAYYHYLPPPIAFAPIWYMAPPAGAYDPRAAYVPPPHMRNEVAPPLVEVPPPRPRSCGRYRYWNGEYCADARYERPYVGPKW
jgi:hypothetical protein